MTYLGERSPKRHKVVPSTEDSPVSQEETIVNSTPIISKKKRVGSKAKGERNRGKLQTMLRMPMDIFYEV